MAWWETGYKIGAGFAGNYFIGGIPASIAQIVAVATTPPDTPEAEKETKVARAVFIGGLIGSVPSFLIGNWVRGQPGWGATGVTQMVFAGITGGLSIAGLVVAAKAQELPSPVRYGMALTSPVGIVLGTVIRPQPAIQKLPASS